LHKFNLRDQPCAVLVILHKWYAGLYLDRISYLFRQRATTDLARRRWNMDYWQRQMAIDQHAASVLTDALLAFLQESNCMLQEELPAPELPALQGRWHTYKRTCEQSGKSLLDRKEAHKLLFKNGMFTSLVEYSGAWKMSIIEPPPRMCLWHMIDKHCQPLLFLHCSSSPAHGIGGQLGSDHVLLPVQMLRRSCVFAMCRCNLRATPCARHGARRQAHDGDGEAKTNEQLDSGSWIDSGWCTCSYTCAQQASTAGIMFWLAKQAANPSYLKFRLTAAGSCSWIAALPRLTLAG